MFSKSILRFEDLGETEERKKRCAGWGRKRKGIHPSVDNSEYRVADGTRPATVVSRCKRGRNYVHPMTR